MHMANHLISPVVGGTFWAVSGGLLGYCIKKIIEEKKPEQRPMTAVMAAFVFAAQMINFSIPQTGSSGHLGGGLLLAILLGPYRAFAAIAAILAVQSFFFADGGILALGCNVFNLGFFPAFIAYPLIFKPMMADQYSQKRLAKAGFSAATAGLLMGAFSVVIQTTMSGISELPLTTFLLYMLPIHLAIGVVEGIVTWSVVTAISKTDTRMLIAQKPMMQSGKSLLIFAAVTMLIGGVISWMASSAPDGLEWSVVKTSGIEAFSGGTGSVAMFLDTLQQKLSFLPDYSFKQTIANTAQSEMMQWGTTLSGLLGSLLVFLILLIPGYQWVKKRI